MVALLLVLLNVYPAGVDPGMQIVFSLQEDRFGEKVNVDLIESGSTVDVTNANKDQYINRR